MNPFTKVTVEPDYGANTCTVNWEIDKEAYEGAEFYVRKSPDGERNIELIQQSLDEEQRSFVDKKFYVRGRTDRMFYQVILRLSGIAYYSVFVEASGRKTFTPDAVVEEEFQHPAVEGAQQDDGALKVQERKQPEPIQEFDEEDEVVQEPVQQTLKPLNREFGIIQHINKLEKIYMKHTGTRCALLKPKTVGELSHEGIDQDTGQHINVFGENRFGQLMEGGFEQPIFTHMLGLQQRTDITIAVQTGEGEVDKYAYMVRMLAHPRVAHDDMIIDTDSDIRYAVKKVDRYQFKGAHDVVQMVMCVALDRSSVLYDYVLEGSTV